MTILALLKYFGQIELYISGSQLHFWRTLISVSLIVPAPVQGSGDEEKLSGKELFYYDTSLLNK